MGLWYATVGSRVKAHGRDGQMDPKLNVRYVIFRQMIREESVVLF